MKILRNLSRLALSGLLLISCGTDRPGIEGTKSSLSAVTIGSFDKPNWTQFHLKLERLRPGTEIIEKSFAKNTDNASFSDATVKVPYGDYRFVLAYHDAQGQALYESCAEEKNKEHAIHQARYSTEIKICNSSTKEPEGSVPLQEADVTITPVPPTPATPGSFVAAHGMLSVADGKIVDKNKQPIQLKGMSLFWSQWGGSFWTPEVVATLKKDWKATLVRAAMGVEEGGYLTQPDAEKARVKTLVDAAIKEGIYVIIDWHDHHATRNAAKAVEFFKDMAKLYGNNPHVIFEIYNEPIDDSWEQVKSYAETVIKAIRDQNAQNLVIVGSPTWSQRVDLAADNPVKDSNVAYTLHFYSGTHRQDLRDKAAYALSKGIALFVTEFGVCDASGNGNIDLVEADLWFEFMDKHKLSWANWSLFDKEESASALKKGASTRGGWSDSDLTVSGAYIKKKIMQ